MTRIKVGKQIERSVTVGSIPVTDSNNEQYYLAPGLDGDEFTIVAGEPAWVTPTDSDTLERLQWYSVKSHLPFSTNEEDSLDDLITYYTTRSGEIVIDTEVDIVANRTIPTSVRFTKGGRLNISTGVTVTFQSGILAPPMEQIFIGLGNVVMNKKSVEQIYPYWFGAKADGATDDYAAIQKAINTAITNGVGTVRFLSGVHNISKGLLVRNGSGSVTLSLIGEPSFDSGLGGTTIYANHNDNFLIGIQGARSCVVRGFYLSGQGNTFNPTLNQVITGAESMWTTNYGRDSRYSPYAGIVIDPFGPSLPSDGGYPGFTSEYASTGVSAASTIEEVVFRYLINAIAISPSGQVGNGSELRISNCSIDRCKVGISTGSSQNRSIDCFGVAIALVQTCADGLTYGQQTCPMPHFNNCQLGSCRDMVRFNLNFGAARMSNCYGESIYRIGLMNGYDGKLMLTGCEISFTTFPETGVNDAASVFDAVAGGGFMMVGGKMTYSTGRAVEMLVNSIWMQGVALGRPIFNVGTSFYTQANAVYEDCSIIGYNGEYYLRNINPFLLLSNPGQINAYQFASKTQVVEVDENAGSKNRSIWKYSAEAGYDFRQIAVENITVSGNTATFTSSTPGKYRVGDVLHSFDNNSTSTPSGNNKSCTYGVITDITGSVVTCSHICAGTTSGTRVLYLQEMRRIVPPFLANITSGSPVIAVTHKPTGYNTANMWPVGSRVYCETNDISYGIPNGAHVISVSGDNITLSLNCTATLNDVEIFDAPFSIEYISKDGNIPTLSNQTSFRRGDVIKFESHPYRISAVVTRGGGDPSVSFVFKPLVGTTGSRPTPTSIDAGLEYFNTTTLTNQWWDGTQWIDIQGLPDPSDMYNSDAEAATGGIGLLELYYAGPTHGEGAVHGTPKLRTV